MTDEGRTNELDRLRRLDKLAKYFAGEAHRRSCNLAYWRPQPDSEAAKRQHRATDARCVRADALAAEARRLYEAGADRLLGRAADPTHDAPDPDDADCWAVSDPRRAHLGGPPFAFVENGTRLGLAVPRAEGWAWTPADAEAGTVGDGGTVDTSKRWPTLGALRCELAVALCSAPADLVAVEASPFDDAVAAATP